MKKRFLKSLIIVLIAYQLVLLVLTLLAMIDPLVFWASIIIVAVFAFLVLPKINR